MAIIISKLLQAYYKVSVESELQIGGGKENPQSGLGIIFFSIPFLIVFQHRMLYEIYQLKTSLNIDDENDEDYEHLANYIYSKRFSANSKPKPPTPPKVLDDNKVTEKLRHYELLMDKQPAIWTTKKNVQLVDANPEIIISERDILQTLIETNVEPNQAERICRTLFHKSKDTTSCQMVGNVS